MHYGNWQDGPGGGSGLWMVMMLVMMVVFWGGIAAVLVAVIRRPPPAPPLGPPPVGEGQAPVVRQAPREILAERLARGEIEPEEYQKRLETLDRNPGT